MQPALPVHSGRARSALIVAAMSLTPWSTSNFWKHSVARSVRAAIGQDAALMIDADHGYDATRAFALGRRLADLDIGWFEEPVPPEDLAGHGEVRAPADPGRGRRIASSSASAFAKFSEAVRSMRSNPTPAPPAACPNA